MSSAEIESTASPALHRSVISLLKSVRQGDPSSKKKNRSFYVFLAWGTRMCGGKKCTNQRDDGWRPPDNRLFVINISILQARALAFLAWQATGYRGGNRADVEISPFFRVLLRGRHNEIYGDLILSSLHPTDKLCIKLKAEHAHPPPGENNSFIKFHTARIHHHLGVRLWTRLHIC